MIVQLAVALTIILIGWSASQQVFDIATGVTGGLASEIMAPLVTIARSFMLVLAHMAPVLLLILPVWWYMRYKDGEPAPMMLVWGALYGGLLYGVVLYTGIDVRMIQAVQQSWSGSTIGAFGAVAGYGWGLLSILTYYMAGIALTIVSVILEVVTGIGSVAESGKTYVNQAQTDVLNKIIGRLTE